MKDTNNLESYNVWSGTDYNKNTNDFVKGSSSIQLTSSNLWSINGENSLQIQRLGTGNYILDTSHLTDVTAGKTITYSCKIYSPDINVNIRLRGKGTNLTSVTAYASDKVQNIIVSATIPEDYDYMCLRFLPTVEGHVCYIDDISCIVS